jgi:hypothetical protein
VTTALHAFTPNSHAHLAAELASILGMLAYLLLLDDLCLRQSEEKNSQEKNETIVQYGNMTAAKQIRIKVSSCLMALHTYMPSLALTSQTGTVAGSVLAHNAGLLGSFGLQFVIHGGCGACVQGYKGSSVIPELELPSDGLLQSGHGCRPWLQPVYIVHTIPSEEEERGGGWGSTRVRGSCSMHTCH